MIRLDLDGDGVAKQEETFWRVFTTVAWRAAKLSNKQREFPIGFDAADVHWMIGYTHLLRAMIEAWLAHDTQDFYNQTAHFFFAGAESPYGNLSSRWDNRGFNVDQIADAVAAIHLVHFQPAAPERLSRAREHLLAMIHESRRCWELALAETDDDREWIPNARQTSLTPLTVDARRIAAWKQFLDEAEAVLQGKKLLPHWRVRDGRGINLKRVFEEPRTFDLVLWAAWRRRGSVLGGGRSRHSGDGACAERRVPREIPGLRHLVSVNRYGVKRLGHHPRWSTP